MSSSLIEASSFHFKPLPFISSLSDPLELGEFFSSAMSEAPILDLPELALECIIEKLSPACLCSMACVCRSLKGKCTGDHPWERHMKEKWSGVIGPAAKKEWELHLASHGIVERLKPKSWMESLFFIWPLSLLNSKFDAASKPVNPLRIDSIMSWYLALECGEYWLPAQVYNRENGHYGFSLSCYDAQLRYDRKTDTFTARYPPHGQKIVKLEEGIRWDRLRASPVDTPAHDLYVSNCLHDLCPGDHFEIQWRKNKEFPYGWWYGVVGHLHSCEENERRCRCHQDDTIILEFKQHAPGSRWRKAAISRNSHREKGDETDGFYGGIRKLQSKDEINMWRKFWPSEVLE
ncbi:F-box protein At2g26850-like [Typha latifolia]|uniref:F-box protein At2g26850-like n=1 Tax=Typha latifolia TaxID=4733 RepID=UPI003C2F35A0